MKFNGFTLSEVLITLGIIGVVAAITLPSVITDYQKKQTITRLKKVYSVLNQAFKLSENDNDAYIYWDTKDTTGATQFYETYWKPYLNGANVCMTFEECGYKELYPWQTKSGNRKEVGVVDNASDNRISFFLNDGTFVSLSNGIYIDLNGAKKPNLYGRDFFVFTYDERGVMPAHYKLGEEFIKPRCSKNNNWDAATCAARLIMLDNWEIKEDYPW